MQPSASRTARRRWSRRNRVTLLLAAASSITTRKSRSEGPLGPRAAALSGRLCAHCATGDGHQFAEGCRVGDRDVGEDLAIDVDAGELQSVDEDAVTHVVLTARGVDAADPKPAEITLARAPIGVGVAQRVHDRFVGGLVVAAAMAVVALGLLEDRAVLLLGVNASFDSCHGRSSSASTQQALDARGITGREVDIGPKAALAARRFLLEDVVQAGLTAAQLAAAGHPEALLCATVRFHLWHGSNDLFVGGFGPREAWVRSRRFLSFGDQRGSVDRLFRRYGGDVVNRQPAALQPGLRLPLRPPQDVRPSMRCRISS